MLPYWNAVAGKLKTGNWVNVWILGKYLLRNSGKDSAFMYKFG